MNCKKISARGIKTVLVTDEYAGRDGASQSLADADASADAVVTAGNANAVIELPPMEKVIGTLPPVDKIAGGFDGSLGSDQSIRCEIQAITGATNELGFNRLSAKGY
jgi:glycine reductase